MLEIINQPWPWYISGPLVGLIVPILLLIGNKSFGISSSLRNAIAACGAGGSIEFFKFDWQSQNWNFLFITGTLLAGFLAFNVFDFQQGELSEAFQGYLSEKEIENTGIFPKEYFQHNLLSVSTLLLIIGGLFIGFGSRYAGGCTSGHAITGMSQMSLSSLIAVIGFFIGGLIVTFLILDNTL